MTTPRRQKVESQDLKSVTGIWHGVTHWMPLPEPPTS
ncbi:DUF551 domain-containing protein [Citrobacter werkmanii]